VFIVGFLVVGLWIGCTVADSLNCRPVVSTWLNSFDDPRYCFNFNVYWMACGVVEAFIDILIIAMPIRTIFTLQLNTSEKIAVEAVVLLETFKVYM
jgi:hypothetical protein